MSQIGNVASVRGGGNGVIVSARVVSRNGDGSETHALRIQHKVDAGDAWKSGVRIDPGTLARAHAATANASGAVQHSSGSTSSESISAQDFGADPSTNHESGPSVSHSGTEADPTELTAEERASVDEMRRRDQQVRQEEEAHAAGAGDLAGAIQYEYAVGPDGQRYVINGSVPVKSASSANPEEAARNGAKLAAAALAAHNPSAADLAAARKGYAAMAAAQDQVATLRSQELKAPVNISA